MDAWTTKKCTVLYVSGGRSVAALASGLRRSGLVVRECSDWPEDEAVIKDSEAVVVHVTNSSAARVAMRLRAKRLFGRRVLVGFASGEMTPQERQEARNAGFDAICDERFDVRVLLATILRMLRERPEFACRIPRSSAA